MKKSRLHTFSVYLPDKSNGNVLSDWKIYQNYMKNTDEYFWEEWKRFFQSLFSLPVVLLLFLGGGFTYMFNNANVETDKQIFSIVSAIAFGFATAVLYAKYMRKKEVREIKVKSEYTVRSLNKLANNVVNRSGGTHLTEDNKDLVMGLADLMDYWKDYYEPASNQAIEQFKALENKIRTTTDETLKVQFITDKSNLEYYHAQKGVDIYGIISGSK